MTIREYKRESGKTLREIAEELKQIDSRIDAALVCKMAKGICEPSATVQEYLNKHVAKPNAERNSEEGVIIPFNEINLLNGRFEETIYAMLKDQMLTSYEELQRTLGTSRRVVRKIVENMRAKGIRICSKPGGFYLPVNDAEYEEFERRYLSAAYKLLKNAQAMRNSDIGQMIMAVLETGE